MRSRLTLLSTPAGAGKTTLLAEWYASPAAQKLAVAWLSLDDVDEEPSHFVGNLGVAISAALDTGGEASRRLKAPIAPGRLSSGVAVDALLRATAEAPRELVIVLDDYHFVRSPELHGVVAHLVERLPVRAHLVIAARASPPLPLARLRTRGELAELGSADLRFGVEEAVAFLERAGLRLPPGAAENIGARTEGWAGGLRLAAVAARGRDDSAALEGFSGRHRAVADYFEQEVLRSEPREVCEFLVRTAMLDRLCGPLCDALRAPGAEGGQSGQRMLERLDRDNVFLVPLDEERRWWRYHRLFAEFLRRRQEVDGALELPELHRRAAAWFERHGQHVEAAGHAVEAGAVEDAIRLIERGRPTRITPGRAGKVLGWLRALPQELVASRPALRLGQAWSLLGTGQVEAAEAVLPGPRAAVPRWASRETATLRALIALLQGQPTRAHQLARDALRALRRDDAPLRALAHLALGRANEALGKTQGARDGYLRALTLSATPSAPSDAMITIVAAAQLGDLELSSAKLRDASRHYEDALRLAPLFGDGAPAAAMAAARLGGLCYEWNELETSARHLSAAIELGSAWDSADIVVNACMQLACVRQAQGDAASAGRLAGRASELLRGRMISRATIGVAEALRACLWLRQGDVEAASRWAAQEMPRTVWREERHARLAARIRVELAQGEFSAAVQKLRRALRAARSPDHAAEALELRVLLAIAEAGRDDSATARRVLDSALTLARPEGWVRLFLDEGEPMARLLADAARRRSAVSVYARGLLAAASREPGAPRRAAGAAAASVPPGGALIEPLSKREREILDLVVQGLANPEIARRLFVSLATVKTHIHNIYGKLGAKSRTDAVARARRLGLL